MKNNTTSFSWKVLMLKKLLSLVVCVISSLIFLATVNTHAVGAVISGGVAFFSFFGMFEGFDGDD
jgi:hypothetical protein